MTIQDCPESKECPFCKLEHKFSYAHFEDFGDKQCQAWIDYAKDVNGNFLWYAVLAGEQYAPGHTLLILGCHKETIVDSSLTESELGHLAVGLNKVSGRMKKVLGVRAVHVLSLCEGVKHLHFHLVPRYDYDIQEKQFFCEHYWEREKDAYRQKRLCMSKARKVFEDEIRTNKRSIDGM